MSDAFRLARSAITEPPTPRAVLITGAAGRIGSALAPAARERGHHLRLLDHPDADEFGRGDDERLRVDLADLEGLARACQDIDTVVHLAADPSPQASWRELLSANIEGTYHVLVAARAAGCRRVVVASSIHAVSGYPVDRQVHAADPVNPGDLYGVSKCFGEALARYLAEQGGLSSIVVRIGAFQPIESAENDHDFNLVGTFCSQRDCVECFLRCIEDTRLHFAIVHALSDNGHNRMDISQARELLAYEPRDSYPAANRDLPDLAARLSPDSEHGGQTPGIEADLARARAALAER